MFGKEPNCPKDSEVKPPGGAQKSIEALRRAAWLKLDDREADRHNSPHPNLTLLRK
jgi:hypothetical protein